MSYQPLLNLLEYLFPKSLSQSKKITDIRWIQKFTPIAPYLSIAISLFILAWGIGSANPTKLPIKPHILVFLGVAFWTALCFVCAHLLKNKGRSPAIPLLISFFISIKGLFALLLFLGSQASIKEIRKDLIQENTKFASHVQSKIRDNRSFINQKFQEKESEIKKHQQKVAKSMEALNHHFEGAFERFKQTSKEMSSWMDESLARAKEETKEMDQIYWDSVHKRQAELEAERKATPSFFKPKKQEEKPSQEETPSIDLPVICDGEKWLREHIKPEYLEGSTQQK